MQTNQDNWEASSTTHGFWRTRTKTQSFGELCVLINSTSDRSSLVCYPKTVRRHIDAISALNNLPQSKHDELLALVADQYGTGLEELECEFDLAEIPLIDQSTNTYFCIECDAPDYEHRLTVLFRGDEILGIVDRDAASEIFQWDSIDEIEALVWDHNDLDVDEN